MGVVGFWGYVISRTVDTDAGNYNPIPNDRIGISSPTNPDDNESLFGMDAIN